jgi:hypothetical protein
MRLASMTQFGPAAAATRKKIFDREEFEVANLSASRPHVANHLSRLPGLWRLEYEHDIRRTPMYEVRSWNTPIAWFLEEDAEWVIPPIGYSSYTSRHQHMVRRALEVWNQPVRTIPRREHLGISIDWDWEVSA